MDFRKLLSVPFFAGIVVGIVTTGVAADMLGSGVFSDVQPGSYYDVAVGRLYGQGIVKGFEGKYRPGDFVTRADVAVMLDRALNGEAGVSVSVRRSSSSRSVASSTEASSSVSISSVANIGVNGGFRFSTEKISFPESAANVSFSVQRYGGAKGATTVRYATVDGTAKSTVRYNQASGVISFADGETTKIINLKFINNLIAEPNEAFTVILSEATGGAVVGTPGVITVTVLDNDGGGGNTTGSSSSSGGSSGTSSSGAPGGSITFSAWAYALDENGGSVPITVLRKGSSSSAVTVNYATAAGSATPGINYTETQGTLSFAAGENSKSFSVQLTHQSGIDGNKALTLKLSTVTGGASLDSPNSVPLTVVDVEASGSTATGSVLFSTDNYTVNYKDKSALVTVFRRGGYGSTVSVNYATGDNSAVSGLDYTTTTGTLTFAPGESNKSFTVPLNGASFTGNKRINLTLGTISGPAVHGTQPNSAITIVGL
ncbi:MAG: peptidase S8 family protein [Candidatus Peregrinibacteria bacterium Greene1014_49]|nr:MAG: peptidase S8 family protein [Candidatus Peregrinibacteria bacterium Greene1014_49]